MTREIEVTRQDRIYCLKVSSDYHSEVCEECRFYPNCDHMTQDDMTELTIEDLEVLEQETCEDCVSREAVDILVDELARAISDERCCISRGRSTATIMGDIKHLSSVTPQQKKGHWIIIDDCEKFIAKCSECGRIEDSRMINKYPYCHCGAKMEVEE